VVRHVRKVIEQSNSATQGLVPASPPGFGSTGNALSLLVLLFQMSLKPSLGRLVSKSMIHAQYKLFKLFAVEPQCGKGGSRI